MKYDLQVHMKFLWCQIKYIIQEEEYIKTHVKPLIYVFEIV